MASRGSTASDPSLRQVLIWAAVSFLMAAAAGATGYLVGHPPAEAVAGPPPPRLLRATEIYASGRADGERAIARRDFSRGRNLGYRAGLHHGRRGASRRFARRYRRGGTGYLRIFSEGRIAGARLTLARFRFGANGFYLVGIVRGGRRVDASHGPLRDGDGYRLCHHGRAVCLVERAG